MPEISMCKNETCPERHKCYRFKAEPKRRNQVYATFEYSDKKGCPDFLAIRSRM